VLKFTPYIFIYPVLLPWSVFYTLPNIIGIIKSKRMRWTGHIACIERMRNVYKMLGGKPEGKTPLTGSRHRWEDNIRMDLGELW
jgi:hypothetical protein